MVTKALIRINLMCAVALHDCQRFEDLNLIKIFASFQLSKEGTRVMPSALVHVFALELACCIPSIIFPIFNCFWLHSYVKFRQLFHRKVI